MTEEALVEITKKQNILRVRKDRKWSPMSWMHITDWKITTQHEEKKEVPYKYIFK